MTAIQFYNHRSTVASYLGKKFSHQDGRVVQVRGVSGDRILHLVRIEIESGKFTTGFDLDASELHEFTGARGWVPLN